MGVKSLTKCLSHFTGMSIHFKTLVPLSKGDMIWVVMDTIVFSSKRVRSSVIVVQDDFSA